MNSTEQQPYSRGRQFFPSPYRGRRDFARKPFSPMVYIDLGLLLVLFFMTLRYSELVLRPGINMQLPRSEFQNGIHYDKFDTILITLSREGMVFFNDELTTMEGLNGLISRASHENPDVDMLIQADARIDYGTIMQIFNIGARAGIEEITLATSISAEPPPEQ